MSKHVTSNWFRFGRYSSRYIYDVHFKLCIQIYSNIFKYIEIWACIWHHWPSGTEETFCQDFLVDTKCWNTKHCWRNVSPLQALINSSINSSISPSISAFQGIHPTCPPMCGWRFDLGYDVIAHVAYFVFVYFLVNFYEMIPRHLL